MSHPNIEIRRDEKDNITYLSLIFMLLSIFTLESFISSSFLEILLSGIALLLMIFTYTFKQKNIYISKVEIMWFIFLVYFTFNILLHREYKTIYFLDVYIFSFASLFLLLNKIDLEYYVKSFIIILSCSLIYAMSGIFQYLYTDLYINSILFRFSSEEINEIMRLYRNNHFTGFTNQTAYLAGFIVLGIGVTVIFLSTVNKRTYKILLIAVLFILIYALILTGKRAHVLFTVVSLLITYLFSTDIKKFFNQIIKILLSLFVFLCLITIVFLNYTPRSDSQFGKLFTIFSETVNRFSAGEDITSGRIYLYNYAINLFREHPIFGIGFRQFRELSAGILRLYKGSHPHNIYIQLLTELGLVGLVLFMLPVIYVYIKTIKMLLTVNSISTLNNKLIVTLQYSLFIQSFFILYGLTGNLLTDHIFLLIYFFAVSILLSTMKYIQTNNISSLSILK